MWTANSCTLIAYNLNCKISSVGILTKLNKYKMKDLIIWLERQIELCDELGNMESEKYAFAHTLKKVRKEAINFTDSCENVETVELHKDFVKSMDDLMKKDKFKKPTKERF